MARCTDGDGDEWLGDSPTDVRLKKGAFVDEYVVGVRDLPARKILRRQRVVIAVIPGLVSTGVSGSCDDAMTA
jgi:hypothetical protein